MRRDSFAVVVVGTSLGGIDALQTLLGDLPGDLRAAVFVTMHVASDRPSLLVDLLARASRLSVVAPRDGDPIHAGTVYVARPDHHLLLHRGEVRVTRGPFENGYRPAIDPMFRSAAVAYGARVIGIVLTGALDDGTAGLVTIKRHGGLVVVQDPREAYEPQMPRSALENVPVDQCLSIRDIASMLPRAAALRAQAPLPASGDTLARFEIDAVEMVPAALAGPDKPGQPSTLTCPDCDGVLSHIVEGGMERFRCQVGHAYSVESLLEAQDHAIERALWTSLRALLEKRNLLQRIAARGRDADGSPSRIDRRMRELEENIAVLRNLLLGDVRPVTPDGTGESLGRGTDPARTSGSRTP